MDNELIKLLNKRIEELKDPNSCYALEEIEKIIKNYIESEGVNNDSN